MFRTFVRFDFKLLNSFIWLLTLIVLLLDIQTKKVTAKKPLSKKDDSSSEDSSSDEVLITSWFVEHYIDVKGINMFNFANLFILSSGGCHCEEEASNP